MTRQWRKKFELPKISAHISGLRRGNAAPFSWGAGEQQLKELFELMARVPRRCLRAHCPSATFLLMLGSKPSHIALHLLAHCTILGRYWSPYCSSESAGCCRGALCLCGRAVCVSALCRVGKTEARARIAVRAGAAATTTRFAAAGAHSSGAVSKRAASCRRVRVWLPQGRCFFYWYA